MHNKRKRNVSNIEGTWQSRFWCVYSKTARAKGRNLVQAGAAPRTGRINESPSMCIGKQRSRKTTRCPSRAQFAWPSLGGWELENSKNNLRQRISSRLSLGIHRRRESACAIPGQLFLRLTFRALSARVPSTYLETPWNVKNTVRRARPSAG